jgi:cysteinyl-tRNA synthetase
VSEYVQEIVQYIEELVRKKIAYESRGSVYFSVVR